MSDGPMPTSGLRSLLRCLPNTLSAWACDTSLHSLRSFSARLCIIALLAGCGTTALKPEPKLVSSVTSLPPVQVPVPVRCVKEIPPIPPATVDPNSPVLARYYQMKSDLLALDEYAIRANAALLACAEPKP